MNNLININTANPAELLLTGLPMQPGDVPKTQADVTDLVENLGYKLNTPVQKGIEKLIGTKLIFLYDDI